MVSKKKKRGVTALFMEIFRKLLRNAKSMENCLKQAFFTQFWPHKKIDN